LNIYHQGEVGLNMLFYFVCVLEVTDGVSTVHIAHEKSLTFSDSLGMCSSLNVDPRLHAGFLYAAKGIYTETKLRIDRCHVAAIF